MRHFYIKQILLTIAVLLCSLKANAYGFEVDGIEYYILSEEYLTVKVTGKTENIGEIIVVPPVVNYGGNEYSVTSIGDYAFNECSNLTSIEIPNGVTSIEGYAFEDCSSLASVTFGENSQLTEIKNYAFKGCSSLTSIEIPNSVTSIGSFAFEDCSSLARVALGESSQLTEIRMFTFGRCSNLTSIEIPNGVTSIEGYAFEDCSSLASVTFGENSQLTEIGYVAFGGCSSLTSIEIPNSVISIHGCAFRGCSSLASVTFGENSQLTSICGSFYGCRGLTSIEIPNSVTSIETYNSIFGSVGAFEGCTSLTSIEIPNSVTSIGSLAFEDCSSLASIVVEEGNPVYDSRENCNAIITENNTLLYGCKNTIIPNSVTEIGNRAFVGCSGLTSIEIPSSVTYIGSSTFYNCSSLASVTFGENSQLEEIGSNAFEGCTSLTSIAIPNSVTYIEEEAFDKCTSLKELFIEDGYTTLELEEDCLFSDCPLETIYLGRNLSFDESEDSPFKNIKTLKTLTVGADVTEILGKTFYDCSNLESIYMKGVPPIIADDTFSNTSYYVTTLYVPEGTLAFYQTANVWKNFWNIQEYEPTSIEDVETDEVNFSITSNGISLSDSEGKPIAIYAINGILVKKIDNYTGEEITLNRGVYIVSVGNKAIKIML